MATHSSILAREFHGQGAWRATVRGVSKSWARLRDYHTTWMDLELIMINEVTQTCSLLCLLHHQADSLPLSHLGIPVSQIEK